MLKHLKMLIIWCLDVLNWQPTWVGEERQNVWALFPNLREENPGVSSVFLNSAFWFADVSENHFFFLYPEMAYWQATFCIFYHFSSILIIATMISHFSIFPKKGNISTPLPGERSGGGTLLVSLHALLTFPTEAGMSNNLGPRKETLWVRFFPPELIQRRAETSVSHGWMVKQAWPSARLSSYMKPPVQNDQHLEIF